MPEPLGGIERLGRRSEPLLEEPRRTVRRSPGQQSQAAHLEVARRRGGKRLVGHAVGHTRAGHPGELLVEVACGHRDAHLRQRPRSGHCDPLTLGAGQFLGTLQQGRRTGVARIPVDGLGVLHRRTHDQRGVVGQFAEHCGARQQVARFAHTAEPVSCGSEVAQPAPVGAVVAGAAELHRHRQQLVGRCVVVQREAQPTSPLGHEDQLVERDQRACSAGVVQRGHQLVGATGHQVPGDGRVHRRNPLDRQIGDELGSRDRVDRPVRRDDASRPTAFDGPLGDGGVHPAVAGDSADRHVLSHQADRHQLAPQRVDVAGVQGDARWHGPILLCQRVVVHMAARRHASSEAPETATPRAPGPGCSWCRRGDLNPHALTGTSPSS